MTGSNGDRSRAHYSVEPGEVMTRSEDGSSPRLERHEPHVRSAEQHVERLKADVKPEEPRGTVMPPARKRPRRPPGVSVVRFQLPPKPAPAAADSDSDDEEDMADYFDSQIEKTRAELEKLQVPDLPIGLFARFAMLSHGSMVKILNESENLVELLGDIPAEIAQGALVEPIEEDAKRQSSVNPVEEPSTATNHTTGTDIAMDGGLDAPKADEMDTDQLEAKAIVPAESIEADVMEPATAHEKMPRSPGALGPLALRRSSIPLETTEVSSKAPSTPSQVADDGDETESEYDADIDFEVTRQYMCTPPMEELPDFGTQAWDKDGQMVDSFDPDTLVNDYITKHITNVNLEKTSQQEHIKEAYANTYAKYLAYTTAIDEAAAKAREKLAVVKPIVEPVAPPPPESKPEGRGGRRYATERDLERVLQASAQEEEERKERELRAQKEKYRSDKEAVIPDMLWTDSEKLDAQYMDRTGLSADNRLVAAWTILPPSNNFNEEEAQLFERRYLELPKQWGKVAEVVPHRDFGTCIQYYYLMKKDLKLKDKLRKQPKKRKKSSRNKQRSSALVSELGNGDPETEENNGDVGDGERRRPRRAAAPTWGFEQPAGDAADSASGGTATPGKRGAPTASQGDRKPDGRKGRRKTAKDKEPKPMKPNQTLAAALPTSTPKSRSRSNSHLPGDAPPPLAPDNQRMPLQFDPLAPTMQHPFMQPAMQPQERQPLAPGPVGDVMGAPSLRPEPPPPPHQPAMHQFNLGQNIGQNIGQIHQQQLAQQDRKAPAQASSYWSVSEANDFPHLLKSFGSDWTAIAAHMGSKTAVMVSLALD